MKSGYLYVLAHPSDPNLYKIGQTTLKSEKRLVQHNSNDEELAGQIVKETGQKWKLKESFSVPDPTYAEAVFWEALHTMVGGSERGKVEIITSMSWESIQICLDEAKNAGIRPPKPLHDWVYAYTAWMKKRLKGRDITLVGHVNSMVSGNATFRCSNGHEWRTRALFVAEGEGCPQCGIGNRTLEEIWEAAKLGYLCLLLHPNKPEVIKIGLTYKNLVQCDDWNLWEDWKVHRYRFVEDPVLAERLVWGLLGQPLPHDREPIKIDLSVAEQALRDLIHQMYHEFALAATPVSRLV